MDHKKVAQMRLKLYDLPLEVLVFILHHLDKKTLGRIAQVSHYFKDLASCNEIWKKWTKCILMTSSEYGPNLVVQPCYKEQYRISRKWKLGRCKIKNVLKFDKNFLPWLSFNLKGSQLYVAVGETMKSFSSDCWMKSRKHLFPTDAHHKDSLCNFTTVHKGLDVCRFCVTDNYIVTGGWHGKLSWASIEDMAFTTNERAHGSDISDVAMLHDVIISGSRDQTLKMWKLTEGGIELLFSEEIHDTILSLAVNKYKRTFAVGTGGVGGVHPLQIKDLESGSQLYSLGHSYKNGAGVLDCHFQSADLLMSAGYDTYIRLWDTRASLNTCVRSWEEPHDNTVYCVASDNRYGFVSGSCRHGVTRLWDTRMRNCLQTFYLGGKVSSPVYTLQFTHSHLFAGLARGVFSLDFR